MIRFVRETNGWKNDRVYSKSPDRFSFAIDERKLPIGLHGKEFVILADDGCRYEVSEAHFITAVGTLHYLMSSDVREMFGLTVEAAK